MTPPTLTEPPTAKVPGPIPPSQHRFAEVIHRLEAGGSMLPDTPENLKQIIGIYKAYAVPMDFYWRDLLYIAEQVFLATDAKKRMAELGQKSPPSAYAKFKVMGKEFDPTKPDAYLAGFAIKKTG